MSAQIIQHINRSELQKLRQVINHNFDAANQEATVIDNLRNEINISIDNWIAPYNPCAISLNPRTLSDDLHIATQKMDLLQRHENSLVAARLAAITAHTTMLNLFTQAEANVPLSIFQTALPTPHVASVIPKLVIITQ